MLKKLDKKFLILAGFLVLFPIITLILLMLLQSCENKTGSYEKYEEKMTDAAKVYFKKNKLLPKNEGDIFTVKLSTLVNNGYIKSSEKYLNDSSCTGTITVRRNGVLEQNEGGFLNYISSLKCKNYKTNTLGNLIMKDLTTKDSGLYKVGNEYIYKGNQLNNYITFYGTDYRIMGLTSNGLIKLIKSEPEITSRLWDNKYNIEVKHSYGKNIYSDSLILQYLMEDYKNNKKNSKKAKPHIVANNICIGKRKKDDVSISKELDCQNVLQNQLLSILSVSDYAMASLDPDCNSVVSKSCNNYNYLHHVASSTWTSNAVLDNTYEVFYVSDGIIYSQEANKYNEYNTIIYLDANEKVNLGTGSLEKPYILKD